MENVDAQQRTETLRLGDRTSVAPLRDILYLIGGTHTNT